MSELELIAQGIAKSNTSGLHYFSAAVVLRVLARMRASGQSLDQIGNELLALAFEAEQRRAA